MGAMAISTLAGVGLVGQRAASPLLSELLPFLKGMTLLFWATATWWIPMLLLLGAWRHVYQRFPLTYEPATGGPSSRWACTPSAPSAWPGPWVPFLLVIPRVVVYVALAAWLLTGLVSPSSCCGGLGQLDRSGPAGVRISQRTNRFAGVRVSPARSKAAACCVVPPPILSRAERVGWISRYLPGPGRPRRVVG